MSIRYNISTYGYYNISNNVNSYGEKILPSFSSPSGYIDMAIYVNTQRITDKVTYSEADYIGLTKDNITDKYIIAYNNIKLKVLYINEQGRYKQVYMTEI